MAFVERVTFFFPLPPQCVLTDSGDVIFLVQHDWSFCILSGYSEKGLFDMHRHGAAGFDVAWWTVDFYGGWLASPNQGPCAPLCVQEYTHACICTCSPSKDSVCLCVHAFGVPMCVLLRLCVCKLWCSIMTHSHLHKTVPMSTLLGCCPHSPLSYPRFFSSTRLLLSGGASVHVYL